MSNYNYSVYASVDYLEFRKELVENINAICRICCNQPACDKNMCTCSTNRFKSVPFLNYDFTTDPITTPEYISSASPVNYEMIQAAIIVASIIWFIILAAIVYRICQRYRSLSNSVSTAMLATAERNTDTNSIDRNVAEWLRDRPPSYRQSYRHMTPEDAPPIYDELVIHARDSNTIKENILPTYEMAVGAAPFTTYPLVVVQETQRTFSGADVPNAGSHNEDTCQVNTSPTAVLHI